MDKIDVDKVPSWVKFQKHDNGKLCWSKFAWGGATWVMKVMAFGAAKYGWDNWRKAKTQEDRDRYLDAAHRHLIAHVEGHTIDKESGMPALAHAACSLIFYLEGVEDAPKPQ